MKELDVSTNVISFFGVTGLSGLRLARRFGEWSAKSSSPSRANSRRFETSMAALQRHIVGPPIVFYRCYSDTWSLPQFLLHLAFVHRGKQYKEASSANTWAVCVSTRVAQNAAAHLMRLRRSAKWRNIGVEGRWFCTSVTDCAQALSPYGSGHIFIHFEPRGLSVEDAVIRDSRRVILPGLV